MSAIERFAQSIPSLTGLEGRVRDALDQHLAVQDDIQTIIYVPRPENLPRVHSMDAELRAYRGRPPASVLVLTQDRLLALTVVDLPAALQVVVAPLRDILRLELGTVLLLSWMEWSWASEGELKQHRVYFNTVGERLLWQLMSAMRQTIIELSSLPAQSGQPKEEAFLELPYKFQNIVPNRLMLPDERVQAMVFQPTIWRRLLGLIKRRRSPTTTVALSREHLLIAQEDSPPAGAAYGMIARYCPRSRIASAVLDREDHDLWLAITLRLHGVSEQVRVLFQPSAEPALRSLLARL